MNQSKNMISFPLFLDFSFYLLQVCMRATKTAKTPLFGNIVFAYAMLLSPQPVVEKDTNLYIFYVSISACSGCKSLLHILCTGPTSGREQQDNVALASIVGCSSPHRSLGYLRACCAIGCSAHAQGPAQYFQNVPESWRGGFAAVETC